MGLQVNDCNLGDVPRKPCRLNTLYVWPPRETVGIQYCCVCDMWPRVRIINYELIPSMWSRNKKFVSKFQLLRIEYTLIILG